MNGEPSLGSQLANASPADRFAVHAAGDRSAFTAYDLAAGRLVERMLRGDRVLQITPAATRTGIDELQLTEVTAEDRAALDAVLDRARQEQRGAWYLPDADKPLAGVIQQAHWAKLEPRYAMSAADADRASVPLTTTDAIAVWSVLQPIAENLWLPLKTRSGTWLGARRPELVEMDLAKASETHNALGIDTGPIDAYRDPGRWAQLRRDEVLAIREALLAAWSDAPSDVGARAVAWHIDQLVARYYAKAKAGRAERAKVLDKASQRSLSAAFGGDWLALLAYLGEEAHEAESITTAVEITSFVASGRERAAQAAAATGVAPEEVERILAAYWDGAGRTPVEERVDVIRCWWTAFDDVHAAQTTGAPSLWGLSDDGGDEDRAPWLVEDGSRTPQVHRLVGNGLVGDIERLWGTAVLPRWPDRLVSEPDPIARFAGTLGVALAFWEGIALTCWFVCEGPSSRTDIAGAPAYYDRQLKALDDLGCPVDPSLFDELRTAERRLTERQPAPGETHELDGIAVSFSFGPSQKDGFEHLRDVVTRHRRAWTAQHLDRYLRATWEGTLRACGDAYHRHTAQHGKPPTAKQFAKTAAPAANAWFAGDITKLGDALGLPTGETPVHDRRLPPDRHAFTARLRERLGGQRWQEQPEDLPHDERTKRLRRAELADRGTGVTQHWEATGQLPAVKGNAWARGYLVDAYGEDLEEGWAWYTGHVVASVRELSPALVLSAEGLPASPPAARPLAIRAPAGENRARSIVMPPSPFDDGDL